MTDVRPLAVTGLVVAGLFAAALLGPVAAPACGLAAAIVLLAPPLRRFVLRWPWGVFTGGVVVSLGAAGLAGVPARELLALLLAWLEVHRRLTRASPADDRTSVLLAGLLLLVAAGRVDDPALCAPIAAWWALLPVALWSRALSPREALPAVAGVSLLAAVAFLGAPRLVRTPEQRNELTGFSQHVELGDLDELLDDPAIVFRAALRPPPDGPVYWRGVALDTFDGRHWSGAGPGGVAVDLQGPRTLPPSSVVVEVHPVEPGSVLFTSGRVVDLLVEGGQVLADGRGGYRSSGDARRYRFVALPPFGPGAGAEEPEAGEIARAASLPADLDPRIAALAASVAGDGTPEQQVDRLSSWLASTFTYTRRPGDRGADEPLATFLLDTRAGHCEYFASGLAVMARTLGIPARVVNGFVGGEVDPRTGWWTIRRSHAHSWTEVDLDGRWVAVDATPGPGASLPAPSRPWLEPVADALRTAWQAGVVEYDRADQEATVLAASRRLQGLVRGAPASGVPWLGLAGLLGALVALVAVGRALARRLARRLLDVPERWPEGPVDRAHARARRHLARTGIEVPAALPPVEAATWIVRHHPGAAAEAMLELAWLYYEVRLGGRDPGAASSLARELAARVCARDDARPDRRSVLPQGR